MPWELIIKSYRQHLGSNSHDHLSGYADDFFDFISGNTLIFPTDVQEQQFMNLADRAAARMVFPVITKDEFKNETDKAKKDDLVTAAIDAREQELATVKLLPRAEDSDIDAALKRYIAEVTESFKKDEFYKQVVPDGAMERLAKVAITSIYKSDPEGSGGTGIVFAGYGEKEYFPKLEEYRCYRLVLGKLYFEKKQTIAIDQNNSADFVPLAKSDMINTFIQGLSIRSMSAVHEVFQERLDDIEKALKADGRLSQSENLEKVKSDSEAKFREGVVEYFFDTHQRPLRRVISMLPIDELADLAETLVYIESLKERVTTPDESVSGPIDVAVISKHDGFIWIKRKHYFNAELNRRFFVKQERE